MLRSPQQQQIGGCFSLRSSEKEIQTLKLAEADATDRRRKTRYTISVCGGIADHGGEIVVAEGRVLYVNENEEDASFVLRPGITGPIAPEVPHHVDPYDDARFYVRFLR